jgi:thioredoxin 1
MKTKNRVVRRKILWLLLLSIALGSLTAAQSKKSSKRSMPALAPKQTTAVISKPLVTFIELGSVRCIPCKAMQPVMKSIESKYGSQIEIVFYDVWKQEQAHYAQDYGIRLIPTQVFLDKDGKELMRHEGFSPEKEIDAFLQSKGLTPKPANKDE